MQIQQLDVEKQLKRNKDKSDDYIFPYNAFKTFSVVCKGEENKNFVYNVFKMN